MIYSLDWLKQIAASVKEGVIIPVVVMRKVSEEKNGDYPSYELKDK
jgi:hypothetical protein